MSGLSRFVMRKLGLGALVEHAHDKPFQVQTVRMTHTDPTHLATRLYEGHRQAVNSLSADLNPHAPPKPKQSFEQWQQEAANLIAAKQKRGT